MKLTHFFNIYLQDTAQITICDDRGNIHYEGRVGECPARIFLYYDVLNVEGLCSQDDLMITCKKREGALKKDDEVTCKEFLDNLENAEEWEVEVLQRSTAKRLTDDYRQASIEEGELWYDEAVVIYKHICKETGHICLLID